MPTRRAAAKAEPAQITNDDGAADEQSIVSAADSQKQLDKLHPKKESKLPPYAQFPLAAILSFSLASLGYSLLGEVTKGELASVSRSQDTWGEVYLLAGWRLIELGLGWYGKLDSLDVAMLDILSHGPSLYLLTAFYSLSASTAVTALVVDVLSVAIPFYLLRPLSDVHLRTPTTREILDVPLQVYTSALSTGIYTVVLVLSLRFVLPRILVLHFANLPSLEPAYTASYVGVLPVTLTFGLAASTFIFAPFATAGKVKDDDRLGEFDPVTATLGETVWFNVWGFTGKSKIVIVRTAVVLFVTGINTFLACTKTIYGIQAWGAAVYASVWVTAALFSGLALAFVGGV